MYLDVPLTQDWAQWRNLQPGEFVAHAVQVEKKDTSQWLFIRSFKRTGKRKFSGLFSSGRLTVGLMEQPQLTVYQMVTFLHLGHVLNAHSININALKVAGQNVQWLTTKICVEVPLQYTHTQTRYLPLPMNFSYLKNFNCTVHMAHFLPGPFLFLKYCATSHKILSTLA